MIQNLAANAGEAGLIPESGRSRGEGNGNPLQYSCWENSMDRGAWRATVHGVARSPTWLNMHRQALLTQCFMAVVWSRICSVSQVCLYLLFSSKNRSAVDAQCNVGDSQGRCVAWKKPVSFMLQSGRQKHSNKNRSVLDGVERGRVGAETDRWQSGVWGC